MKVTLFKDEGRFGLSGTIIQTTKIEALAIIESLSQQLLNYPEGVNSNRREFTTEKEKYISFLVKDKHG